MRYYLQLILVFFFMLYTFPISAQPVITTISCDIIGETAQRDDLRIIAEKLITVKKMHPLDTFTLNESIKALSLCRLFSNVSTELSGDRIQFLLTPAEYIRDILIKGEYPLFEDEVGKALTTQPGAIFTEELLSQQDSVIDALYKREGFICPQIKVTSVVHRTGTGRILSIDIKSGAYYRLKAIQLKGNKGISSPALKRRMRLWRTSLVPGSAGRFLITSLREDLKTLTEYYASKGFADIVINDSLITDSLNRSVELVLTIVEGDRYKVTFPSYRKLGFRKSTLLNDVAIYKSGNRNNTGVRKSVSSIKKRYLMSGYQHANVEVSDTAISRRSYTRRNIHFFVNRGERTTVASITINGANTLGEELVRSQMLHTDKGRAVKRTYNPEKLEEDVLAIQMMYLTYGFMKTMVSSAVIEENNTVDISINITEGQQTLINKVMVDPIHVPDNKIKKVILIDSGDVYRNDRIKKSAQSLQAIIAEYGYPYVSVVPVITMSTDSSRADVTFRTEKGPSVVIGEIHHTGVFHTRKKVISNALGIKQGAPLSLRSIVKAQKELRDLGPFSSVRFITIGLKEKRDTIYLFTDLTERHPYYGSIGGGYQSNTGPLLNATVGNRNLLGLNKELVINGEVSLAAQKGGIGFTEPRLFSSPIRAMVNIYGEQGSELNLPWDKAEYGISGSLITSPVPKTTLGLTTGYKRKRFSIKQTIDIPDTLANNKKYQPRNVIVVTPSITIDRRDSFTRPLKGVFLSSSIDISNSLDNTLDDFIKFKLEARVYITPFKFLTLAGVVRGGHGYSYGGSSIPQDHQFYLGGTQDLRGFDENLFFKDTSGRATMLFYSIETRINLGFNVELTAFADAGQLQNDIALIHVNHFRTSAGTGIRYITPIGPIGLLYGWKINRNKGERPGAFHFSIGYTF
jgi:outer membrane protein insertion porin family